MTYLPVRHGLLRHWSTGVPQGCQQRTPEPAPSGDLSSRPSLGSLFFSSGGPWFFVRLDSYYRGAGQVLSNLTSVQRGIAFGPWSAVGFDPGVVRGLAVARRGWRPRGKPAAAARGGVGRIDNPSHDWCGAASGAAAPTGNGGDLSVLSEAWSENHAQRRRPSRRKRVASPFSWHFKATAARSSSGKSRSASSNADWGRKRRRDWL